MLRPVVDPYEIGRVLGEGDVSPEAQAFVVLMHQAWVDWKRCERSAGVGGGANWGVMIGLVGVVLGSLLL